MMLIDDGGGTKTIPAVIFREEGPRHLLAEAAFPGTGIPFIGKNSNAVP